jgi:glycerophosphoryl diester phosphodiesterase
LCSESQDVIRQVAEISNGAILIRPKLPNAPDPVKELADTLHPRLVNCDSPERFRDIHRAGMKVFTNTMSEPGNEADAIQTAIDAGADYIQTDWLDILVPLLKERGIYAPMETVSLH